MPVPYARHLPVRLTGGGSSVASASQSSLTSVDFPTPGSPTSVTRCGSDCADARRYVARRSSSSFSRPTNTRRSPPTPRGRMRAERAYDGDATTPSGFPFASTVSRCRELERSRHGGDGALAGEHLARLRSLLETIGDVDGVSCDERASLVRDADDDVPGVHSDAELELAVEETPPSAAASRVRHAARARRDPRARPEHRTPPSRRRRRTSRRSRPSARSPRASRRRRPRDAPARARDLRSPAYCGRADQVGEENRDELALLACAHGGSVAERSRSR